MSDVVMGDPKTVLEGGVKYRDKKKWKSRWAVVSKLSPVADCLHIQLYRDSKERCKNGPTKASLSLEEFLGMETGFTLDKESNTMALICSELVVVLAFDCRELLIQWQVKIRANLVEEQQFLVQIAHVPPKSKLPCGPARLHLQDHNFCLVSSVPPRLLGTWPIKELRRFGVIEGKFCFEGGSLCGKGEGLHVLLTNQCEELSRSMDLASKGKLLGKRKTLTRKNSVLETSSRAPLHKRCHLDKSGELPGSGSECSTCDACSEVLRTADACVDDIMYASSSSASVKASSCRIHYRWPSCLSRWGQSSTTTTSDVDSVDTVSVILSDFQGSHSGTMSKTNCHGQSMSCLCDTQGTWPFNQCSKCGRQLYSRHSMQSCKSSKPSSSPERSATVNEDRDAFSPQWTMDSVVGSRKEQNNSTHDRASLCSRASHSSSNSGASSSGSEYSVPKNFLETLYDKPKNVQQAMNGTTNGKPADPRRTIDQQPSSENCILCPCHEPMGDWLNTREKPPSGQPDCACWNKLAMAAVRNEVDIRMVNGRKSASANPSPSSSPKKSRYGASSSTLRSVTNSECEMHCTCGKGDPYANYAIPKSALMHPKDVPVASGKTNGSKDAKMFLPAAPAEDYDVPKKFQDLLSNCDMTQKSSAIKSISNGPSCSCMSACKIVQNIELFKMASKQQHSFGTGEGLQMCACQRVMLWAGSLVPCLGPQRPSLEGPSGGEWQCPKAWFNSHPGAVCSEPHRTAEVVMVNGKPKHVLREASVDSGFDAPPRTAPMRPRASTVSYPLTTDTTNGVGTTTNYANLEFAASEERLVKVSDEPSAVNYANIEFAETLSLYENSSLVLSRMDKGEGSNEVCASKPPLPPRSARKQCESPDKEKCKCKQTRGSPKKTNAVNGSAYEMMSYPKNPSYSQTDEDYLMMQPLCVKSESSPSKQMKTDGASTSVAVTTNQVDEPSEPDLSTQSTLPLRPFMPFSYPISESGDVFADSSLSRKHQLINEDLHLRAMRSNSLSELKKKVLMRKRSSSVDGKNNGYLSNKDSGVESVPASPVGSPRPSAQRKNSLFSKLTLRSKEKSMSTNEIALPPLPSAQNGTSSCTLTVAHKNGHHRSADCLKPSSEDFTNSDEDLNSDSSDFVLHKDSVVTASPMKRSSSVPCRAAMPSVTVTSPAKGVNHRPVEELNDLNKEPSSSVVSRRQEEEEEDVEPVQRKYSLDSHERKKRVLQGVRSNCDNMYRQEGLDESDTVMEMQGILRRNHIQSERVAENYRSNTSSCSSSDISDYMESLSFISRSSSSSSGSADYMRSEDLYGQGHRGIPKPLPPLKNPPPGVHQSSRELKHRSDGSSDSSSDHHPCYKVKEEPLSNPRPCVSSRGNRDSTSSTSSLSTSPSVTDYSSSSSSSPQCPNALCGGSRQVFDRRKQELLHAQQQPSTFVFGSNNCADKEVKKS